LVGRRTFNKYPFQSIVQLSHRFVEIEIFEQLYVREEEKGSCEIVV
jgi:hypothetical protein